MAEHSQGEKLFVLQQLGTQGLHFHLSSSDLSALSTEPFHPHPHCPALHSPKAGENTGCIFLLFSTQMAAKSSRARMKIKTLLQKVTQDNILQPSSHVLSVQSSSEAPTVHLKCGCVTNQGTKGHLIPSHQQL